MRLPWIAGHTHHYGGDQTHRKVLGSGVLFYGQGSNQANNTKNHADIKKIASENVAQCQICLSAQR